MGNWAARAASHSGWKSPFSAHTCQGSTVSAMLTSMVAPLPLAFRPRPISPPMMLSAACMPEAKSAVGGKATIGRSGTPERSSPPMSAM